MVLRASWSSFSESLALALHAALVEGHLDVGAELALLEGLEQVGEGLGNFGFLEDGLVGVCGEEYDGDAELDADEMGGLDAIHRPLEHDVHEDKVGVRKSGRVLSPPRRWCPSRRLRSRGPRDGPGYRRR